MDAVTFPFILMSRPRLSFLGHVAYDKDNYYC
jgi:hypothetical protein